MQKLGDVIFDLLDNSDSVLAHLNAPNFPEEYKPEKMTELIEEKWAIQETRR